MATLLVLIASCAAPPAYSTPADAAWHAALDAPQLNPLARPFTRYIWVPDRSKDTAAAVSFALNTAASTSTTIQWPTPVAAGMLLRIDIREWCPTEAAAKNFATQWEKLAQADPWFHADSNITVKVATAPYKAADGQTYDYKYQRIRQFALGADVNSLLTLRTLLGTDLPIAHADWLMGRMLTTLDGGQYYGFRGIQQKPAKGTALEAFLESLGADPKNFGQRPADEKAAIRRSKVTGKPRVVCAFFGRNVRPSQGLPLVTVTLDIQTGDIQPNQSPFKNLIAFNFRASEIIGVLPNGMLIYALFNAAGELQDVVPPNIAHDSTIPSPHDNQLQPALGCIRCHGPHDGLQPFRNDVRAMFDAGLSPLGDFGQKGKSNAAVLDQIRGLYTGELGPVIVQARTAHAVAAFRATGGVWGPESVQKASAALAAAYDRYTLSLVTPETACRELGYPPPDDTDVVAYFEKIVPRMPVLADGTRLEEEAVASLRLGDGINRFEWEHVFQDCLIRANAARLSREGGKNPLNPLTPANAEAAP